MAQNGHNIGNEHQGLFHDIQPRFRRYQMKFQAWMNPTTTLGSPVRLNIFRPKDNKTFHIAKNLEGYGVGSGVWIFKQYIID